MLKESNLTEKLISKIAFLILFAFLFFSIVYDCIEINKNIENLSIIALIGLVIYILFIIWKIFILYLILNLPKIKYKYSNFEISFHPFFKPFPYVWLLSILSIFLIIYFSDDINKIPSGRMIVFHSFIVGLFTVAIISVREGEINKLPVKLMQIKKIRMIVEYQDYINHKISDDEPHLILNQFFETRFKEVYRDNNEKNSLEIRNPNTPENSALVTILEDEELSKLIRNGKQLKIKLIDILEFGKLEIDLWIED